MLDRPRQTNFSRLDEPTLAAVSITERYDLQAVHFEPPCALLIAVGQEPWQDSEVAPSLNRPDRINTFAVGKAGIPASLAELKRGINRTLQAILTPGGFKGAGTSFVAQGRSLTTFGVWYP